MQDSRFDRYESFVAAAVVAAHANLEENGFRQRDVKFLIELFSNWVEGTLDRPVIIVQNNQVARYLSYLCSEGYSRQISRKGAPRYRLSRPGLIELLSRCVHRRFVGTREHFFFILHFITAYREILIKLVESEGRQFPSALKLEVEALLDAKTLVHSEIEAVRKELSRLEMRLNDTRCQAALVRERLDAGVNWEDVVKEAQREFPYELNNQKPLVELMASIPESRRKWELTVGGESRAQFLWEPQFRLLKAYLGELERFCKVN